MSDLVQPVKPITSSIVDTVSLDDKPGTPPDQDEQGKLVLTYGEIAVIVNRDLLHFKKVVVIWCEDFSAAGLPPAPAVLDTFKDLMKLNLGKVYKQLEKDDKGRTKFGLIPALASGSKGCLGLLPVASCCERCNSVAKDVTSDAHCLMYQEYLEMLVVL